MATLAPHGLHLVQLGPTYAAVAWDSVPGATQYLVEYADTGALLAETADTQVQLTGLAPGTTYRLRVLATGPGGLSAPSLPLRVTTP
jgi:chitodextrinase